MTAIRTSLIKAVLLAATFHLALVFCFSLRVNLSIRGIQSKPVGAVCDIFENYGRFWFFGDGYAFFSPNPPPMYGVRLETRSPSGEVTSSPFADKDGDKPRLRYHRKLLFGYGLVRMFLADGGQSPGLLDELARFRRKELGEGQRLDLILWRHRPIAREAFLKGEALDVPSSYDEVYRRSVSP